MDEQFRTDEELLLFDDMELDKIPGAWVVTYWLKSGVTLRLKIQHTTRKESDRIRAEVRMEPGQEFQPLHEFTYSVYENHPEDYPGGWSSNPPPMWRREIYRMAVAWATTVGNLECATSFADRYAREPQSSLDCLEVNDSESRH